MYLSRANLWVLYTLIWTAKSVSPQEASLKADSMLIEFDSRFEFKFGEYIKKEGK